MRVERLISNGASPERVDKLKWYANWLLRIGDDTNPTTLRVGTRSLIPIPSYMLCDTPKDLRQRVYPDFERRHTDKEYLMKRAILGCKNDLIQQRNNEMIELLPGDTFESISTDYCMNDDDNRNVDVNTLNSLEPSGLPPHRLLLKRNACVILMRSLIPRKGFCNGKRCLVKDIRGNLLVLTPLDGTGPDIFVP